MWQRRRFALAEISSMRDELLLFPPTPPLGSCYGEGSRVTNFAQSLAFADVKLITLLSAITDARAQGRFQGAMRFLSQLQVGWLARESHPHLIRASLASIVTHLEKVCNSAREPCSSIACYIGADNRNHHVVSGPDTLLHRETVRVRIAPPAENHRVIRSYPGPELE
jgi:hypothetical protein